MVVLQEGGRWWRFAEPVAVVVAERPEEVMPGLRRVEAAVDEAGLHAAGFISYEAAAAFDLAVQASRVGALPLLWFGLYRRPVEIEEPSPASGAFQVGAWQPSLTRQDYDEAIAQIKEAIAGGYTYQVNYTFQLQAPFQGDAWSLFGDLVRAQQAAYAAYVDTVGHVICSASPELFFRLEGDLLTARPMKGTAPRGRTWQEDQEQVAWLRQSEKNQAENVMIVDMIRNDMGRVAAVGSVNVPQLFEVERYPTLLQMTSTVQARTDAAVAEVIAAMFPCASITGAPKVRTMKLIAGLEQAPRGVYTGAIGYIAPGRQAQFNVAIRTVVVDRGRGRADYGAGSGIVWDSDAAGEYEECLLKTRVLTQPRPRFSLLESMLWTPAEGYFLAAAHRQRLADSAGYFGIPLNLAAVDGRLAQAAAALTEPSKVRLLVAQDGAITVEAGSLDREAVPEPVRVGLAKRPVDAADIWLYHKTTRRQVYDAARASRPDCGDVILWNERGEITEASSANVVVALEGQLYTPPVMSGLLAGTFREALLASGRIRERVISVADLKCSQGIYLINSVRRWREARLSP